MPISLIVAHVPHLGQQTTLPLVTIFINISPLHHHLFFNDMDGKGKQIRQ
jgi:hypothetical protein